MLYSSPMQVTSAVRFVSWAFCVRITCPTLECQKRSAGWQSDRAERCPKLRSAVMTSLHEISETESFQLGQLHSTQHPRKFGESSGGLVSSCDAGLSSQGCGHFFQLCARRRRRCGSPKGRAQEVLGRCREFWSADVTQTCPLKAESIACKGIVGLRRCCRITAAL